MGVALTLYLLVGDSQQAWPLYSEPRMGFMSVQTSADERAWRHSDGSWFHLVAARKEIERLPKFE